MSKYIGNREMYFREGANTSPRLNDCRIIYDKTRFIIKFQRYNGSDWVDVGRMRE